jgi:uncharacterized protein (DUF433 family)
MELHHFVVHRTGILENEGPDRRFTAPDPQLLIATTLRPQRVERFGPRRIAALSRATFPFCPTTRLTPGRPEGYSQEMEYQDRITIEPGKRGGKPCIRGLRITVYDILEYLASGMTEDEILSDFPDLEREDIRAALAFAAERERRLVGLPPA